MEHHLPESRLRQSSMSPPQASRSAFNFSWCEEFSVGHTAMDTIHREFVTCVDRLLAASDVEQKAALNAFEAHARSHFAEEDESMRASGYESAGCHIEEHSAVLKSIEDVRIAMDCGRHQTVREFAFALVDWFPEHARVMDLGLAKFLNQKRFGGIPVQFYPRRSGPNAVSDGA